MGRRWVGSIGVITMVVALSATPAGAGYKLELPHTERYGIHALIDTSEFDGGDCAYDLATSDLNLIAARRPVVYARDRTSGTDSQVVGRRVYLEATNDNPVNGVWQVIDQSGLDKATATDRRMAALPRASFGTAGLGYQWYRLRLKLYWYAGGNIVGTAQHRPFYYHFTPSTPPSDSIIQYCPTKKAFATTSGGLTGAGVAPAGSAPLDGPHSGTSGPHMAIDTGEYPGMTCVYDAGLGSPVLERIRMRRPIVLAAGGRSSQTVGFAYWIEYADSDPFNQASYTRLYKSPWRYATASNAASAVFDAPVYAVPPAAGAHAYYRVRYLFRWLSGGAISGRATHWLGYYRRVGWDPDIYNPGFCETT